MTRSLMILFAVLALAVAGCGGSDDSAESLPATIEETTTDETTTDETTTDETTTDEGDTDATGIFSSADCLQAVSAFGVLAQAAAGAGGGDTDESLQAFRDLTDRAPDEIRDDLAVLAEGYAEYIQTWNDLGLEQGETLSNDQIQELSAASEAFNTSEFQTASQNWDAWLAANCQG